MSKGKQGYGSTRVALTRKPSRRDERRAMIGRARQRQERQERETRGGCDGGRPALGRFPANQVAKLG